MVLESSRAKGAAEISELETLGAQCLTRIMASKAFVRATRPTLLCASPIKPLYSSEYHTNR